jgi:hypothetical protein
MKKLIVLFVVCVISVFSFGQNSATITKDALVSGKSTGKYVFVLPSSVTTEKVDAVKGYYKDYYSTNFDAKSHTLTVQLIQNEEKFIRVINRMMVGLEIRDFNVSGTTLTFEEMFQNYMK